MKKYSGRLGMVIAINKAVVKLVQWMWRMIVSLYHKIIKT